MSWNLTLLTLFIVEVVISLFGYQKPIEEIGETKLRSDNFDNLRVLRSSLSSNQTENQQHKEIQLSNNKEPSLGNEGGVDTDGEGAATRGNCSNLLAVVPPSEESNALPIGITVSQKPVIYTAISHLNADKADFLIQDSQGNLIDKQTINLSNLKKDSSTGKLFPLNVTSNIEPNKSYTWTFSIICNPNRRDEDDSVKGVIQVIKPSPELEEKLANSRPQEKFIIYAEAGIWYDSLASIASSYISSPTNQQYQRNLAELLNSAELSNVTSFLELD